MSAIIIKTVNEVTNLDAINSRDANAFLILRSFDFVNNRINVRLEKEVLDAQGQITREVMQNFQRAVSENVMNNLWTTYGNDLLSSEQWTSEIRAYMAQLLKLYAQNEGWFGLTAADWEIVTP